MVIRILAKLRRIDMYSGMNSGVGGTGNDHDD